MVHLYLSHTEGKESPAAHMLLDEILEKEYGLHHTNLSFGPQGKPYLPHGPEFSISHSWGYIAIAVSDMPVGVDVELVRPYMERLPERVLSKQELQWFRQRFSTKVDFFTLWTLKESYYKYRGTGLLGFPNDTQFYQDEQGKWHLDGSPLSFHVLEEKKILLTVCCQEKEEIRIHRM